MDWSKQANEMIKTWSGSQQKVWETWMSSMQMMSSPQSPEAWQRTVESWRGTVKQALEAQVELTRLWAEGVAASAVSMPSTPGVPSMPGVPSASTSMVEWTRQMLDMTRSWTETQVRFSESWFDLLKKVEPGTMAQTWDAAQAQKILATWQEASQKAIEAQNDLAKMMLRGR